MTENRIKESEDSRSDHLLRPALGNQKTEIRKQETEVGSQETDDRRQLTEDRTKGIKFTILRRGVLFAVLLLFVLQFFRIKVLVGGLSGSLAVWFVKLIDVFAYLESLVASKDFTVKAFLAVIPIIVIYVIFGRAFCGWICPMDFLFEIVNRMRHWEKMHKKVSQKTGYIIAGTLLLISFIFSIPVFTNYLSHLTNFFRLLTSGVFLAYDLPVEPVVLYYSIGIIALLIILEYLFPRLWCRVLCPVGKIYGLFNKISLLKLKLVEGECGECNFCEHLCYMDVKITPYLDREGLRDTNCIYCGRCTEGCDVKGKLIKMGFRLSK